MTPKHRAKLEHIASEAIMADTREAVAAALARIDALEADAARLDWLEEKVLSERYFRPVGIFWDEDDGYFLAFTKHGQNGLPLDSSVDAAQSVREAIDAAREGK